MQSNKSLGNDGLTKESYETFWTELKEIPVDSVSKAKEKGISSISQREVIIKLIEKRIKIRDSFKTEDLFPC